MLTTSICEGFISKSGVCLKAGQIYFLEVSLPPEPVTPIKKSITKIDVMARAMGSVGWSMCGETGGVPASMEFEISGTSTSQSSRLSLKGENIAQCKVLCAKPHLEIRLNAKALQKMTPYDEISPGATVGWHGGYYSLYDEITGTLFAGGTLIEGQGTITHRICPPSSTISLKGNGSVVAIFSDGQQDTNQAVSYSQRTWDMCGSPHPNPLVTDFTFFKFDELGTCEVLTPSSVPDLNISPIDIPGQKEIRVGLFSAHFRKDDHFKSNNSQWSGMEYAIKRRNVDANKVEIDETYLSNGTIPSLYRTAQYQHPLSGIDDWVFLIKKQGHDGPQPVPLPKLYYPPTAMPSILHDSSSPTIFVATQEPTITNSRPTQVPKKSSPPVPLEKPSKGTLVPSLEPSTESSTSPTKKTQRIASVTSSYKELGEEQGQHTVVSSILSALGEIKLPDNAARVIRQSALHALTTLTMKSIPDQKTVREFSDTRRVRQLQDKKAQPTFGPSVIAATSSVLPTYHPTVTSYPTRAVTPLPSHEDAYFMSCGLKGKMNEYYKFHRTTTDMGCERSCTMLTGTSAKSSGQTGSQYISAALAVNYEYDTVLAFITLMDGMESLYSIRRLSARNYVCLGNATSPSAPQSFKMMLGGGSNLVDPQWSFCGQQSSSPASLMSFTVRDWTDCTNQNVASISCSESEEHPMYLFLYSDKGIGWSGASYSIRSVPTTASSILRTLATGGIVQESTEVKRGTLVEGKQTGFADLCIKDGCYSATVADGLLPDDIFFVMCGSFGTPGVELAFEVSIHVHVLHDVMCRHIVRQGRVLPSRGIAFLFITCTHKCQHRFALKAYKCILIHLLYVPSFLYSFIPSFSPSSFLLLTHSYSYSYNLF